MWRAGYKYSWRKMEAAAQNRAGNGKESGLWPMVQSSRQVRQVSFQKQHCFLEARTFASYVPVISPMNSLIQFPTRTTHAAVQYTNAVP